MFRIDNSGAVASLPTPQAAGTPGYFSRGNAQTGTKATPLSADWANMIQEEFMSLLTAAGLTQSKTAYNQVLGAISALFLAKAGGTATGAISVPAGAAGSQVPQVQEVVKKSGDTLAGVLAFALGSVSAPGMAFSGDLNTGIYSPGADQLSFVTAGVERRRTDATGNVTSFIPGRSGLYPDFACRAWVNFNGTNGAVRAGGNFTVTRTGVGVYALTFVTAMPDANYCPQESVEDDGVNGSNASGAFHGLLTSATSFDVYTQAEGNASVPNDFTYVTVTVHR